MSLTWYLKICQKFIFWRIMPIFFRVIDIYRFFELPENKNSAWMRFGGKKFQTVTIVRFWLNFGALWRPHRSKIQKSGFAWDWKILFSIRKANFYSKIAIGGQRTGSPVFAPPKIESAAKKKPINPGHRHLGVWCERIVPTNLANFSILSQTDQKISKFKNF